MSLLCPLNVSIVSFVFLSTSCVTQFSHAEILKFWCADIITCRNKDKPELQKKVKSDEFGKTNRSEPEIF